MAENVGKRCEFAGNYGIVRYFGEISNVPGSWYGIEWDEQRGKHDGSYNGQFYFNCRDGYGSFVRPQKVNFGIGVCEAIEMRYGSLADGVDECNLYVLDSKNQRTLVEVVGFDQVENSSKRLKKLHKVSLVGMHVNGKSDNEFLKDMVPNVCHLDLSENLFTLWAEIVAIIKQLKSLEILNISKNRLSDLQDYTDSPSVIESLTTIFANKMKIDWNQVMNMTQFLPKLYELHVCFNCINSIPKRDIGSALESVRLLNLEGNEFSEWDEVMKLSKLESLETLILNNNKLAKIQFPKVAQVGFKSLQSISLSFNNISEWLSINQLAYLSSLKTLKFKSNPLCEGKSSLDIRLELIARLKQIETVNGSKVITKERYDAEILYLKKYASLWRDLGGVEEETKLPAEFLEAHPRFLEMIKTYGAPIESTKKMTTLKDNLISLYFQCPDTNGSENVTKKVPLTMTIQQLKTLLQRVFKIKAIHQKLSYYDNKIKTQVDMDDVLKDLAFYSISEGDTIIVRS